MRVLIKLENEAGEGLLLIAPQSSTVEQLIALTGKHLEKRFGPRARATPAPRAGSGAARRTTARAAAAPGQHKGAKFSTFKAHISVSFYSFQLIFGRVIISPQVLVG